jgi:hypothetical protein
MRDEGIVCPTFRGQAFFSIHDFLFSRRPPCPQGQGYPEASLVNEAKKLISLTLAPFTELRKE